MKQTALFSDQRSGPDYYKGMARISRRGGFSLIELLVVVALMAIATAASTSLIRDQLVNNNTYRFNKDTEDLAREIRQIINNPEACAETMNGLVLDNMTNSDVNFIKDGSGNNVFTAGAITPDRKTQLLSINLSQYQDEANPSGRLLMTLTFDSVSAVVGSSQLQRTIQISTTKDGADNLTGCGAKLSQDEGLWEVSGTTNLRTSSAVGIGTDNPQAALDVKGGYIHAQLDCRVVENAGGTAEVWVNCDADEYLINGGGACDSPIADPVNGGYLHGMFPNFARTGYGINCFHGDLAATGADTTRGHVYGICCKK